MGDLNRLPESPNIPVLETKKFEGILEWARTLVLDLKRIITDQNTKINNHMWKLIHVVDIASNVQSYIVSNLDGDTDVEYMIICRFVCAASATTTYQLRLNNDSANNYGYQAITGAVAVAGAVQSTADSGLWLSQADNTDDICMCNGLLFAKSGYERTMINHSMDRVGGTTVNRATIIHSSWSNTSDNVRSMVFYANQVSGIGVGSRIEVWSR